MARPATHRPPIGRPVPGGSVRVLDDRLRPLPFGVPGEICVSGACVATGYAGDRPDGGFVPDPADPGSLLTDGGAGGRRLVACYTGDAAAEEVRAALAERLPAQLVPSVLHPVPVFPRTASGKTDRAALRARHLTARASLRPAPVAPDAEPRRPVRVITKLWGDVLGVGDVHPEVMPATAP